MKSRRLKIVAAGLAVLAAGWFGALVAADRGPSMGQEAKDFELETLSSEKVKLSKQAEKGPVVVMVLRGYPGYQCPLCTKQVGEFLGKADEFKKLNATVLMIYPGPAAELKKYAKDFIVTKKFPEHFILAVDPDYAFTNAYGLRWEAKNETAYPATFVVGTDRKIAFAKVSSGHGDRAKADDVLKAIPTK